MKRLIFAALAMLFTTLIFAQSPQAFNYQGVARGLSGTPIPNQNIGLQIAVLQGSANGTEVYKETHNSTTTDLGLFNLQIGAGVVVNGIFENIDWGNGSHFLQIEIDETGESNYQLVGTSELLSVPYALFAENGSKWRDSEFDENGLQYGNSVIIGEDRVAGSPLLVNYTNRTIGLSENTAIAQFRRLYNESGVSFNIYGYPDTDLVHPHLRKSVMLYASEDADDLVICAAQPQGKIRFFTQNWDRPNSERMRINQNGNIGIGTINPQSKLQVEGGDIYIEDIDKGVIMKSPDGQCWRYTPDNSGQLVSTSIPCPE